jgi:hypothetical protein
VAFLVHIAFVGALTLGVLTLRVTTIVVIVIVLATRVRALAVLAVVVIVVLATSVGTAFRICARIHHGRRHLTALRRRGKIAGRRLAATRSSAAVLQGQFAVIRPRRRDWGSAYAAPWRGSARRRCYTASGRKPLLKSIEA